MTLTTAMRHVLRVLLHEWQRGERELEELFAAIEELIRGGVIDQPPAPPDQ